MGNTVSDDDSGDVIRKAIIPFRVRNNGFQVDYKIFKFRSFTKAKVDEATDTKYDDSFLELNTRSKIVGDIRKVLTISAETISEEYATLRKNYYSRIFFGILTFFIGFILTNIGLVQNELPKGRIMIIFGGLLLMLTVVTLVIVLYTDRRLKHLNKEFVSSCVKILEKEKIVTWTASFQHLLFDIIYPYNGKSGTGAVILTPNPYFEMLVKTTDDIIDIDVDVNKAVDRKTSKLALPIPPWAIEPNEPSEEGPFNEERALLPKDRRKYNRDRNQLLPPAPSDDGSEESASDSKLMECAISCVERSDESEEEELVPPMQNSKAKEKESLSSRAKDIKAYIPWQEKDENKQKIHGACVQNYFHENPEDIEGHGEDTALLENLIQDNGMNEK